MQALERGLGVAVRVAAFLGVASLAALMVLTVVTVLFRAISIAFPGTYVLAELLLIPTVSFSLAYAGWSMTHTRVDLLTQRFNSSIARIVRGLTMGVGAVFWVLVTYASIQEALRRGRQGETSPILGIPVAPFRWLMVAALVLLIAVLVLRALQQALGRDIRE